MIPYTPTSGLSTSLGRLCILWMMPWAGQDTVLPVCFFILLPLSLVSTGAHRSHCRTSPSPGQPPILPLEAHSLQSLSCPLGPVPHRTQCFPFKVSLAGLACLFFHMNFSVNAKLHRKMFAGIFIRITLNLYPKLERTDILMMLECPDLPILGLCGPHRSVLWFLSHGL